jgi:WD40 repeat protein
MVASGGQDGTVRLWNGASGAQLFSLTTDSTPVRTVAFSPDGRYIAAGGRGGVRMWNTDSGEPAVQFVGEIHEIVQLAFDADSRIVMAYDERDSSVRVWETATGQPRPSFKISIRPKSVVFHPTGMVAELGTNGRTTRWDLTGKQIGQVDGSTKSTALAVHPGGPLMASGDVDGTVRVWKLNVRGAPQDLESADGAVSSLKFSPDGQRLAAVTQDGLTIWDLSSGQVRRGIDWEGITCCEFTADSRSLVAGGSASRRVQRKYRGHRRARSSRRVGLPRQRIPSFRAVRGKLSVCRNRRGGR